MLKYDRAICLLMHAGNFNFTCKSFGRVDSECINMSSWALMRHNICAFEWHSNLFTNLPGSNWKVPFKQQRVPIRDVGNGMLGHVKCVTSWISCMFAFYCETFNFPRLFWTFPKCSELFPTGWFRVKKWVKMLTPLKSAFLSLIINNGLD